MINYCVNCKNTTYNKCDECIIIDNSNKYIYINNYKKINIHDENIYKSIILLDEEEYKKLYVKDKENKKIVVNYYLNILDMEDYSSNIKNTIKYRDNINKMSEHKISIIKLLNLFKHNIYLTISNLELLNKLLMEKKEEILQDEYKCDTKYENEDFILEKNRIFETYELDIDLKINVNKYKEKYNNFFNMLTFYNNIDGVFFNNLINILDKVKKIK